MHFRNFFFILSFIISSYTTFSQSNTIVIEAEFKATRLCNSDSTRNHITYYVRKDILRVDLSGDAANSSIIFQPSAGKIWVLFHVEQVYYIMESHEMKTVEEEVHKQADEFQTSLNAMDEKSRSQIEMIWPDGNPFMFEDPEYKLVKKKDSLISQLICNKYEGFLTNGNSQLLYTNDLKTTGIKNDELAILNEFSDFMGKGVKALSGNMDFCAIKRKEVGGYPILLENYNNNILCNKYWLKSIYRKNFKNEWFQIPLPYGKFENPLGR